MNKQDDKAGGIIFVWQTVIDFVQSCKAITVYRHVVDEFKPLWPKESWKTFVLWISLIILDPLICYVPVIDDERKLLNFDKTFSVVLLVLYVVIYMGKLSIYGYKFHKKLDAASYSSNLWWAFVVLAPLVPVFTNGLLLFILNVKPTTIVRASLFSVGTVVFLILYLAKVLGIYKLFIAAANTSETRMKSAVLRVLVNLLLYFYGGHLFGGLWYFFAVWKKMECWNKACVNHSGCYYRDHRFIVTSGDNGFLDDVCFNKADDKKIYELGIFKDALESGIVETTNIAKKLLYCFRWGAQNLSGFGQNLEVSTHAWENVFVILIAIYGMATFTFFIGNMQNLIKSSTDQPKNTRWRRQDLEKWSPFGKLSKEKQNDIIKKCQQYNWPQTGVVNVKNLLSNLPRDVENDIKRALISLDLLKKVKEFNNSDNEMLNELIDCAKPVCYEKHDEIIQHDSPIDEMLILVQGKIWIHSFPSANDGSTRTGSKSTFGKMLIKHLEDDAFCGEELAAQFGANPHSSDLPLSTKTIGVVKRVDAFALMAYDLQNIFKRHARLASTQGQTPPAEFPPANGNCEITVQES